MANKSSELLTFKKKYKKEFSKATVVAYAMFLDMALEKAWGRQYKKNIAILKDRFSDITANELSNLIENVKEFGRDLAFDWYELIVAHRNDRDWRGRQYTLKLPSNEELLRAYELEKRRLSELKLIKSFGLKILELKTIYPHFIDRNIQHLIGSPPSKQALFVLSVKYGASALYIRNKLTKARKKK